MNIIQSKLYNIGSLLFFLPGLGNSSGLSFSLREVGSGFTKTVKIAVKKDRDTVRQPMHETNAIRYIMKTIDSHLKTKILSIFRQIKIIYIDARTLKVV